MVQSLAALPDELLLLIALPLIEPVDPKSGISLARSCKRVHALLRESLSHLPAQVIAVKQF